MIRHTNAIFSIVFILILTSANILADDIKHEKYTDYKNGVLPKTAITNAQIAPSNFVGKQSSSAAILVYYGDRATFNAENPTSMTEDFENTLVPDFGVTGTTGPYDSSTNNAAFAPGGIMDGIRFAHVGVGGDVDPASAMVATGDGFFGLPTATIGPNWFSDDLDIIFPEEATALGLDIYDPFSSNTVNISIYGIGDVLLGEVIGFPLAGGVVATFWGVKTDNTNVITHIRINDPVAGSLAQLIDDVSMVPRTSAAISGYVRDGEGNAVPGVDVAFSNGGSIVTTDANGRYVTSVSAGWHGTSTASMAGWTFVPTGYDYSTPVYSNQMNQDFTATQLPVSLFINGNVRDGNGVGIEGVAVSLSNGGATVYTNAAGYYTTSVAYGWNGTATPTMDGMWFNPSSMDYPPVTVHQTDQNYSGAPLSLLMTGFVRDGDGVGINAVAVTFSNGGATVYTDATGEYAGSVAYGWNGTATPSKAGYGFWPLQHTYLMHLTSDQLGQDFTATMVDQNTSIQTSILPAYPNPFNPSTTITYGLDNDGKVSINIYDISGRLITNLIETDQVQGLHSIIWNGTNQYGEKVPAGMYLSILESGNDIKTTKLMLLK